MLCYRFFSVIGRDVEKITDVLLEVDNWESLAGWLEISHYNIRTNCALGSEPASCFRRTLIEIYCDQQEPGDMYQIANDFAQVLDIDMDKRRQADTLKLLVFTGPGMSYTEL